MRERLDCAVVSTSCTHDRVSHWFEGQPATGRLHLRALGLGIDAAESHSCRLLANASHSLLRFVAWLLPLYPPHIDSARTSLLSAHGPIHNPSIHTAYELQRA